MATLNAEMTEWLLRNMADYEFYMMHAIFHDPLYRSSLLATPLTPADFLNEEYAIVVGGLITAQNIMRRLGKDAPYPPTPEYMKTYVNLAAREEGSDDEVVDGAMKLVETLQDPSFKDQHYCVNMYFEAWYSTMRAKKVARLLQQPSIPDVRGAVAAMQNAMAAAAQAAFGDEEDEMEQCISGTETDVIIRRSTGLAGLDECMNGGTGPGECYLLFGGTGSGKSVAAGQIVWNEADTNNGFPLIVSTELRAREYVARIVSAAASIPISIIQDCGNFEQIRNAVSKAPSLQHKHERVEKVLSRIEQRLRVAKVTSEDGMDSRELLQREMMRYENKYGQRPTLVILDWLGSVADIQAGSGRRTTSERAMAWETAANGCVKFAEATGIPTLVLAQAVNDAQMKRVLTINDIGISKGIGKNMTLVVGVTNSIDYAGIKAAATGKADIPSAMFLEDQLFCVCKARKGEGRNVRVRREFRFQRFAGK